MRVMMLGEVHAAALALPSAEPPPEGSAPLPAEEPARLPKLGRRASSPATDDGPDAPGTRWDLEVGTVAARIVFSPAPPDVLAAAAGTLPSAPEPYLLTVQDRRLGRVLHHGRHGSLDAAKAVARPFLQAEADRLDAEEDAKRRSQKRREKAARRAQRGKR